MNIHTLLASIYIVLQVRLLFCYICSFIFHKKGTRCEKWGIVHNTKQFFHACLTHRNGLNFDSHMASSIHLTIRAYITCKLKELTPGQHIQWRMYNQIKFFFSTKYTKYIQYKKICINTRAGRFSFSF